jgi:hypothetical protein
MDDSYEDGGDDGLGYTSKGDTWRPDFHEAVKAAFEKHKKQNTDEDQYFELRVYVWGNNPVREYKVIPTSVPGLPPG